MLSHSAPRMSEAAHMSISLRPRCAATLLLPWLHSFQYAVLVQLDSARQTCGHKSGCSVLPCRYYLQRSHLSCCFCPQRICSCGNVLYEEVPDSSKNLRRHRCCNHNICDRRYHYNHDNCGDSNGNVRRLLKGSRCIEDLIWFQCHSIADHNNGHQH